MYALVHWICNSVYRFVCRIPDSTITGTYEVGRGVALFLFNTFGWGVSSALQLHYTSVREALKGEKATNPRSSENKAGAVPEMAIAVNPLRPVDKLPAALVHVVLTPDNPQLLGHATFVRYAGKICLLTALHVVEAVVKGGDELVISKDGFHYPLQISKLKPHLISVKGDLVLFDMESSGYRSVNSILRCGVAAAAEYQQGAITVYSLVGDEPQTCTGVGKRVDAFHLHYRLSTIPGTSGSAIWQNGKVVGFHSGALPDDGMNYGFLLPFHRNLETTYAKIKGKWANVDDLRDADIYDFIGADGRRYDLATDYLGRKAPWRDDDSEDQAPVEWLPYITRAMGGPSWADQERAVTKAETLADELAKKQHFRMGQLRAAAASQPVSGSTESWKSEESSFTKSTGKPKIEAVALDSAKQVKLPLSVQEENVKEGGSLISKRKPRKHSRVKISAATTGAHQQEVGQQKRKACGTNLESELLKCQQLLQRLTEQLCEQQSLRNTKGPGSL